MKKLFCIIPLIALLLVLVTFKSVSAAGTDPSSALPPDGISRPLAANTTLWYQFEYGGDRTPIEVRLIDGGAPDIALAVYTPEQMSGLNAGDRVKPIGQITRSSGSPEPDLHWVGNFNRGGAYYVAVTNPSSAHYTIRLIAQGYSVSFPHTTVEPVATTSPDTVSTSDAAPAPSNTLPIPLAPLPSALVASTLPVGLPGYVGEAAFDIPLTARPAQCTPPALMPANVTRSTALCPGLTYGAFHVTGNNLTIFGDPSAVILAPPRDFGITVTGSNVTIANVRVAAVTHPADVGKWLCIYEACTYNTMYQHETVRGGIGYGGGILLQNNSNSAVVNSVVSGGTVGVASVRSVNNKIVNNNLSALNGWGALIVFTDHNYVVGNITNDVNRGCVGPDGFFYQSGCESAGIACVGCQDSVIVSNHCERAGNCYYATGEGGLASNNNKFFDDYCAAASNNCFEITYSTGNQFDYNTATFDPFTQQGCTYPFWIAGSIVYFGRHNTWACTRPLQRAIKDSQDATDAPTEVRGL